ncbi:hypothetical protein BH10PSE14_BH10PSE14_10970 [soil metagenome]
MNLRADRALAVLFVGVIGVMIPGLQPQLLGALVAEGRLSLGTLGIVATLELLVMGIAAGAAGAFLPVTRIHAVAGSALLLTAAADMLTPFLDEGILIAARIAAGLGEGLLIWIAIGFIVRTDRPERWSGVYLAVQTLSQLAFASGIGYFAAVSATGFFALGAVTLAGLLALPWLPSAYQPLVAGDDNSNALPSAPGLLALAGVAIYLAFIVAVWVYLEPLALELGIAATTIRFVAPLSLAMQVLGAGTAAILAGRMPARAAIAVVGLINLGLLAILAEPPSATAFLVASALFGFFWLFVLPFQIPVVIAADPSRRAALLIGSAQLIGSSLGPVLAGMSIGDKSVAHVLSFGAACAIVGIVALIGAAALPRRSGKV